MRAVDAEVVDESDAVAEDEDWRLYYLAIPRFQAGRLAKAADYLRQLVAQTPPEAFLNAIDATFASDVLPFFERWRESSYILAAYDADKVDDEAFGNDAATQNFARALFLFQSGRYVESARIVSTPLRIRSANRTFTPTPLGRRFKTARDLPSQAFVVLVKSDLTTPSSDSSAASFDVSSVLSGTSKGATVFFEFFRFF